MKTSSLKIDILKTCGKKLSCTGYKPVYEYVNNQKTDNIIGTCYEIVLVEKGFERLNVKVPGANTLPEIKDGSVPVAFDNLEIGISCFKDKIYITGKATAIHQVNNASV